MKSKLICWFCGQKIKGTDKSDMEAKIWINKTKEGRDCPETLVDVCFDCYGKTDDKSKNY